MYRTILRVGRGFVWALAFIFFAGIVTVAAQKQTSGTTERTRKPAETQPAEPQSAAQQNATPAPKNEDPTFKGMKYRVLGPFRGGRSLTAAGIAGDPTTYYFGATGGGVWKSTDGAMTWSPVFDKEGTSSNGDRHSFSQNSRGRRSICPSRSSCCSSFHLVSSKTLRSFVLSSSGGYAVPSLMGTGPS